MPKRSSRQGKPQTDENQAALNAVARLTGGEVPDAGKNPAAVYLGRLGGKKGGPARARKLGQRRRTEIARKAAVARWKSRKAK